MYTEEINIMYMFVRRNDEFPLVLFIKCQHIKITEKGLFSLYLRPEPDRRHSHCRWKGKHWFAGSEQT